MSDLQCSTLFPHLHHFQLVFAISVNRVLNESFIHWLDVALTLSCYAFQTLV